MILKIVIVEFVFVGKNDLLIISEDVDCMSVVVESIRFSVRLVDMLC